MIMAGVKGQLILVDQQESFYIHIDIHTYIHTYIHILLQLPKKGFSVTNLKKIQRTIIDI